MLLSELLGKQLRDEDGRALGRVVEVRAKGSRVDFRDLRGMGFASAARQLPDGSSRAVEPNTQDRRGYHYLRSVQTRWAQWLISPA